MLSGSPVVMRTCPRRTVDLHQLTLRADLLLVRTELVVVEIHRLGRPQLGGLCGPARRQGLGR